ncbi:MAG: hypothetical protein H7Z38_21945 [Rubrivivax sp.]|nr:hypothetical protein [Pyrinomonadaceae bacterium]
MNDSPQNQRGVLSTVARLLTFRLTGEEFGRLDYRHLLFGLLCTWLVGVGRWWDDPRAGMLQHAGVGSVVYVFILAALLWLVVLPLKPRRWSYRHVLTFVALTSPPAIIYAIPVEMLYNMETASGINAWFLFVVATWRVSLLVFYLRRHARLGPFTTAVAVLLPIIAIVFTLTALNLEKAAFETMGGMRGERTANDASYAILTVLSLLSILLIVPIVLAYSILILRARSRVDELEDV